MSIAKSGAKQEPTPPNRGHIRLLDFGGDQQQRDPRPHRRRGRFPYRDALIRLVGAVLAEQHDEWAESRSYLGLDVLTKSRAVNETPTEQEDTPAVLTARTITANNHPTTSYTTSLDLTDYQQLRRDANSLEAAPGGHPGAALSSSAAS